MSELVVLDPTNAAPPAVRDPLPRPVSLAGLAVGLLDNGKPGSDRFLDHLVSRLGGAGLRVVSRARKPSIGRLAPERLIDELVDQCDVVITGVGDCAGCCSCSVQDGIRLERNGIPSYVVCTTQLVTTASIAARAAGVPSYPMVVIDHPLGSLAEPLLADRAADAYRQIVEGPSR